MLNLQIETGRAEIDFASGEAPTKEQLEKVMQTGPVEIVFVNTEKAKAAAVAFAGRYLRQCGYPVSVQ